MRALTTDLFRAEGVFQNFHPLTLENSPVAQMVSLPGKVADTAGTDDQELTVLGEFPGDPAVKTLPLQGAQIQSLDGTKIPHGMWPKNKK